MWACVLANNLHMFKQEHKLIDSPELNGSL